MGNEPRPAAHIIGDFGARFFAYHIPSEWVIHEHKGSEDYGVDFHVEIFSEGRPTGLEFGVQVKTTARHLKETRRIKVKRSSLAYALGKPYPCMAIVVSERDKAARYSWFEQMLKAKRLSEEVQQSVEDEIWIGFKPSSPLKDAAESIQEFCRRWRESIRSWLEIAQNHRRFLDLYLDIHAALDGLLECNSLSNESRPDMVSQKTTYTMTLMVLAYGILHREVSSRDISFGPLTHRVYGTFVTFMDILDHVVPMRYLEEYVQEEYPGDIYVCPIKPDALFPNLRALIATLRDVLRSLAAAMATWRNEAAYGIDGLASFVLDQTNDAYAETDLNSSEPAAAQGPPLLAIPAASFVIRSRNGEACYAPGHASRPGAIIPRI